MRELRVVRERIRQVEDITGKPPKSMPVSRHEYLVIESELMTIASVMDKGVKPPSRGKLRLMGCELHPTD